MDDLKIDLAEGARLHLVDAHALGVQLLVDRAGAPPTATGAADSATVETMVEWLRAWERCHG